jgi:hypothetical protein
MTTMQRDLQILRHGFLSLPFIGSAHAACLNHDFGFGLEVDRQLADATVWLGRWEVNVSGSTRGRLLLALPLLTAGAMLASFIPSLKVSRAGR